MVTYFTNFDKNYLKPFVCVDTEEVERDQQILSKVIKRVSDELKKPNNKNKEEEILGGDKIENICREVRSEVLTAEKADNNDLNEKLLENNKDF